MMRNKLKRCMFGNTIKLIVLALLVTAFSSVSSWAKEELDLSPVKKWLARMDGMKSLEASFVQQKFLRTLSGTLTSKGHIWIQYPDDFRWELGEPASTIAIRNQDVLTILKPKKKRAQRFSLAPKKGKDSSEVPAAIHSASKTFPRTMEELEQHFVILDLRKESKVYELVLKPKDKSLSVAMRKVLFFIDAENFYLHGFEIQFRDKSRVRTTFTKLKFNPEISNSLLNPDISDYKLLDRS